MSIVKWEWDFGDGRTSSEANPKHTYRSPGVYTVKLTVTDDTGAALTSTRTNYIWAQDYSLGEDGLLSGVTDFCMKCAVKKTQGVGVVPFSGVWVWPMLIAAVGKGYNNSHESLSLVIDSRTMKIYRIGIPELWVDREGGADESEIACEAMLPEITPRAGDQDNVRHIETHVAMRSWDELNYKSKSGFDSNGFRTGMQIDIEIYASGEQITPTAVLEDVTLDGDYAFLREIEAKRMQIKLKYSTSAFRTTKIGVHCQEIDKRTPPQRNYIPQKQWQKELANTDIWFYWTNPLAQVNLGDGIAWTGTITGPTTGPDTRTSAANSVAGLSGSTAYATGDLTISGWIKGDGTIYSALTPSDDVISVSVSGDNIVFVYEDGTETIAIPTSTDWRLITIVRDSGQFLVYNNGVYVTTVTPAAVSSYGGVTTVGIGECADIRRLPSAVSASALSYYYANVIANGGVFRP